MDVDDPLLRTLFDQTRAPILEPNSGCFICVSRAFADDVVERALFIGFVAGLGAQQKSRAHAQDVIQFMAETLCDEHGKLWSELSIQTVTRILSGRP